MAWCRAKSKHVVRGRTPIRERRWRARTSSEAAPASCSTTGWSDRDTFLKQLKSKQPSARVVSRHRCGARVVEAAVTLPFEQGIELERNFCRACAIQRVKALRDVFFAERAASRFPMWRKNPNTPDGKAAVIGFGTMGGGIAMCFVNSGIPVTVFEKTRLLSIVAGDVPAHWEATARRAADDGPGRGAHRVTESDARLQRAKQCRHRESRLRTKTWRSSRTCSSASMR